MNHNACIKKQRNRDYPYHLLLVDGHALLTKAMMHELAVLGADVDSADNGENALLQIKENRYDLIFMDVVLPDTDGFTLTKTIRALVNHPNQTIPIVAQTAYPQEATRTKALAAGMNACVTKPLTLDKAAAILEYCLRGNAAWKEGFDDTVNPEPLSEPPEGVMVDWEATASQLCMSLDEAKPFLQELLDAIATDATALALSYEMGDVKTLQHHGYQLRAALSYLNAPRLKKALTAWYDPFQEHGSTATTRALYQAWQEALSLFFKILQEDTQG